MINYLGLAKSLKPYAITDDKDMPWAYQRANPAGRPLHDDWIAFKSTPRIKTAFKVPLPFKLLDGNATPEWVPLLPEKNWPLAPDAHVEIRGWTPDGQTILRIPHVLTMTAIHPAGQWSRQAAFLNGQWVECYYSRSVSLFGKRLTFYSGLKLDANPQDLMAWFPEASASVK